MMDKQDKVSNHNPKYDELQPKRDVYRAVYGGTDAIQKGKTAYLPKYPAEESYEARLKVSTIDGIVAGGVESLVGSVFDGEIDTSKVNSSIQPLLENIDNQGNHFNVFVRDAFRESFDGNSVILVDMPQLTEEAARLRQERGAEADIILNTRPYWTLYKAVDVINWRYRVNPVTSVSELALLVVKVVSEEPNGMFVTKLVTRYRVWYLDGSAVKWQVWIEKKSEGQLEASYTIEQEGTLANVTGIPVGIVGDLCDEPKLLTESRLEVKAYQKESSFDQIEYLSIPIAIFKGRPTDMVGKPLPFGPGIAVDVSEAGDAMYMQIDSSGHESLKGTINGIKDTISSRLDYIAQQPMPQVSDDKTATQVITEDKDKQARLVVWADQLKDAIETALGYTAEFMGMNFNEGGEIVLQTAWQKAETQKEIEAERAEQRFEKEMKQPELVN